ncbi:sigma-E factor negative regulatory protein [Chitinimonas lacunae]|uniref:Sigma-E factor negative regulatory protein n=1 Tax=Chitinimonas lacunae TaxID=1963018 RepID=A0ABV8MMC2_9NEIS
MQEKLSAMIDGELDDHELDALLSALDEEDSRDWDTCHLIGDALNQHSVLSSDFMERFSARLDAEPIVIAPAAIKRRRQLPRRRWVALSMAASVAFVSATAWYVGRPALSHDAETIVSANAPVATPVLREAVDNPYLAAHQSLVGSTTVLHRPVILTGQEAERMRSRPAMTH